MRLILRTGILALLLLLGSTVISAEREEKAFGSPWDALKFYDNAIRLEPDKAELYRYRGVGLQDIRAI
jgi:hypothetical protein